MTLCEKLYVFKKRILNFVGRNSQIGNKGQLFVCGTSKRDKTKLLGIYPSNYLLLNEIHRSLQEFVECFALQHTIL